ncbi:DUF6261 family protein [uncultured Parabacteroides sp.]|uniref:DUF6261 family protein n=1 Tax=uncultured Parabacteroides sp. TaxID=512312 RepID=UPI0025EF3B85|nr:DUF6261 family protein [uncultured Parabacteroides sp.]
MEISTISVGRMNNGAHYLYNLDFYNRIDADTAVKEKLTAVLAAYKQAIDNEDAVLKVSQKSLNSDKISEFDKQRDSLFMAIKAVVKAQLSVADQEVHAAAVRIDQLIKDYKLNVREQLDKETGLLINIIYDLENKYADEVHKLGLDMFLTQLKSSNLNVRTYTDSRNKELLDKPDYKLAGARKATDAIYQEVVRQINAHVVLEGDTLYKNLIMLQNQEIVHYKQQVLKQSVPPSTDIPLIPTDPDTPGGGDDDRPVIE